MTDREGEWQIWYVPVWNGKTNPDTGDPVYVERKQYRCPFCYRRTVIKENFCPTCGADMRVSK